MIEQRVIPQRAANVDTAHFRKGIIKQHGVRIDATRKIERSAPSCDSKDGKPVQFEHALDRTANPLSVAGNEDEHGTLRCINHCRS